MHFSKHNKIWAQQQHGAHSSLVVPANIRIVDAESSHHNNNQKAMWMSSEKTLAHLNELTTE